MQGTCGENENGIVPCAVERDNHKFEDSDKVLAILRSECPELFVGKSADYIPDVCCSPDDVMTMQKNMEYVNKAVGQFCMPCVTNLQEFMCHLLCAPNQEEFMEILKSNPTANGTMVEEINYYVTRDSFVGMFNSCKNVPIIQAIMKMTGCAPDKECGIEDFANAFGKRDGKAPIQMNTIMTDKGTSPTVNGKPGKPADFYVTPGECSPSQ